MIGVLLAVVLAQDGGTPSRWADSIYSSCPANETAGFAEHQPDAGYWLVPDRRFERAACLLESCEASRKPAPTFTGYLIASGVSLAIGIVLGIAGLFWLTHL